MTRDGVESAYRRIKTTEVLFLSVIKNSLRKLVRFKDQLCSKKR